MLTSGPLAQTEFSSRDGNPFEALAQAIHEADVQAANELSAQHEVSPKEGT